MPKNKPIIQAFDWRSIHFTVPEPDEASQSLLFSIQDEMRKQIQAELRKQIQAECERVISAGFRGRTAKSNGMLEGD